MYCGWKDSIQRYQIFSTFVVSMYESACAFGTRVCVSIYEHFRVIQIWFLLKTNKKVVFSSWHKLFSRFIANNSRQLSQLPAWAQSIIFFWNNSILKNNFFQKKIRIIYIYQKQTNKFTYFIDKNKRKYSKNLSMRKNKIFPSNSSSEKGTRKK